MRLVHPPWCSRAGGTRLQHNVSRGSSQHRRGPPGGTIFTQCPELLWKIWSLWLPRTSCLRVHPLDAQQWRLPTANRPSHGANQVPFLITNAYLFIVRVWLTWLSESIIRVSALSLTRLQLSGTNSLFLSTILPLSALFYNLPWKPFPFLQSQCPACPDMQLVCVCVCACVRVQVCVCVCAFMLYALNFDKYVFVENV